MNKVLSTIGLTENESKIYIGYINNPNKSAAQMSRILKMDKSSCYKAVESLLSKGLIIRQGWQRGTTFSASNPDSLLDIYNSRENELKNQKDPLTDLIKRLKQESKTDRSTYISIDKGVEGLKLRMTESLVNNKEKLIRENFNNHPIFRDPEYVKFIEKHAKERVKKRIHIKELQSKIDRKSGIVVYKEIMRDLKKYLKEQRDLPENFKDNNSFRIWDDTAIILSSDENGEFIVLTIRDRYMVTLLKSLFDFLWLHSTPVRG